MALKEPNGPEIIQLMNGLKGTQGSSKNSPDKWSWEKPMVLKEVNWWMVLK